MNNNQGLNPNQVPNNQGPVQVNSVPPQNQQAQILNQVNMTQANQPAVEPVNQNNFINQNVQTGGVNMDNMIHNDTSINDLNVDGAYNRINVAPDYVNDKQVRENMDFAKKNTVPVSKELKTVIVIAAILLIFIIVMPFLFDLISNIRFN